ncbi:fibronectin type III domain-containing protein [Paenibacillus sp. NPDC056579]|uniref:fibronectin type III domain-containing protein n=1 Tax=Paenibacillus sp. NPDC056579 TaxID=3345871 RepID=UPI003698CCF1
MGVNDVRFSFNIMTKVVCFFMMLQFALPLISQLNVMALAEQPDEIKINFQPSGTPMVQDYLPDYGEVFGLQNGYQYGWNISHTDATVVRSTYQASELNSHVRIRQNGYWEMKLDNGSYEVSVSVGDAVYSSNNTLFVEGIPFLQQSAVKGGEHLIITKPIDLKDGKITIRSDESSEGQTAIQFIEIKKIGSTILKATAIPTDDNPTIGPPPEAKKNPGDKVILSGKMNNEHNSPPFIRVRGLQEEIERYMQAGEEQRAEVQSDYERKATPCSNCDSAGLLRAIENSTQNPVIIKAGHLNLDSSITLGSSSRPVVLIANGINMNRKLDINVTGLLIVKGNVNANSDANVYIHAPRDNVLISGGSLWVEGNFHLNNNSILKVDDQLFARTLIYNNGLLDVQAKTLWISDKLHINTKVQMQVEDEMVIGDLVSNNETATITIRKGDLFIHNNVHVNNHLEIKTGGWFAMGGDMTANKRPIIQTGNDGQTQLKYTLHGLKAKYYSEGSFKGNVYTKVDETIDLNSRPIFPVEGFNDRDFSVIWSGQVEPQYSENYKFEVDTRGAVKLWVDDQLLLERWDERYQGRLSGNINLEAGKRHNIRMEYSSTDSNPKATLYWESTSQRREVVPQNRLYPFATPVITAIPTETGIVLRWTPIFNADGYELEIDGTLHSLGNLTEYNYDNLESGTLHSFRIRANSGDLIGQWSPIVPVWTLPDVPSNIRLDSTSTSVQLEWDAVRGATGYDVEFGGMILDNGASTLFVDNDLNPNTQRSFRVRAKNSSGPGKWSNVISKITLPGVPGDLTASASDTSIKVAWSRVSGASGYDLMVDGIVVDAGESNTYSHDKLGPYTTHQYQVRSKNSDGTSEWSLIKEATTLPRIPEGIMVGAKSASSLELTWTAVEEAEAYEVEVDGVPQSVGTSTSYTHSGLSPSSEHTYRVRVKNVKALGSWSSKVSTMTWPGIPQNVQAAATSGSIVISWDPVFNAAGYDIEVDGLVVDNGLNTFYEHKGINANDAHTYRVRAKNAGGTGEWADAVIKSTIFGKPQNLTAVATSTSITLSWDLVPGATGYDVFYDGDIIDNGASGSFEHRGLDPYSWHVYRVRAKNDQVVGEWSDSLTKVTVLGTPSNIQIDPSSTQITLSWDSVQGATGYEIEADGVLLDNGSATSYVHQGLQPNTNHSYRIRAKNEESVGEWSETSAWSLPVAGTTAPKMPSNVKASATPTSITLTWDSVSNATGYDVEIDGKVMSGHTSAQYIHEGLEPNTMHVYRVRSRNSRAVSGWTEPVKKTTTPQLTITVEKDNFFNFVVVVPNKAGLKERKVTIVYDPDAVEVLDLSAMTPQIELTFGDISGTNMTVDKFTPGEIVMTMKDADKTVTNIIKFISKTNEYSKITYTVE